MASNLSDYQPDVKDHHEIMADPASQTAPHLKYEMRLLRRKNMQLSEQNAWGKDAADGLNESKRSSVDYMIADLEKALAEERTNYRQLLQIMVETAEENAELSVQLDKSRECKKVLETELDSWKKKLSRVGDDFKKLQRTMEQQEATIRYTRSVNHQVKFGYTKYKLACQKLNGKLCKLCRNEVCRQKSANVSPLENETRMELSKCLTELAENEINEWLRDISRIYFVNAGELKRLETECEVLRKKSSSREQQFTQILTLARARVLSLQESVKTYQTEINCYKERIMLLDREIKEMTMIKENGTKDPATAGEVSQLKEENTRLRSELDHTHHEIETLTQRINTLQELSRDEVDDSDFYVPSSQRREGISTVVDEFESVTDETLFTSNSNSINHSVLRTISMTSDTTAADNSSYDECKAGNLRWVNEDEEKLVEEPLIDGTYNVVAVNENNNSCHSDVSVDPRTVKRKIIQATKIYPNHPRFQCKVCPARCASIRSLGKHTERVHFMHARGGMVTKRARTRCTIRDYKC